MTINTDIFGRGAVLDFESYNLFMPSGLLYLNSLGQPTSNKKGVRLVLIINIFDSDSFIKCKACRPY